MTKSKSLTLSFGASIRNGLQRIKKFIYLFGLNLIVQKRNFFEWLRVVFRYYRRISFLKVDLLLLFYYLFRSPYRMSKKFLIARGEKEVYAYGETPLTSLDKIMRACDVTTADTVFELGSGRGRGCFWMNNFIGCKVVGIEWIPAFVEIADKVKVACGIDQVSFIAGDIVETDFSEATVIYLYGTCLKDEVINKLIKRLEMLPRGTKIITISYSLLEYDEKASFEVMKLFSVPFTWGDANVFLHYKK